MPGCYVRRVTRRSGTLVFLSAWLLFACAERSTPSPTTIATAGSPPTSAALGKGEASSTFANRRAQRFGYSELTKVDQFVEYAQQQLRIPGIAVAIVQGGSVIHTKGYGVRDMDQ